EIGDDARFYWVADLNEDDRNRAGRLLGRQRRLGRTRDDQVDRKADELGRQARQRFGAALGEAPLDAEVLPLHPAKVAQALAERAEPWGGVHAVRALGSDPQPP